MPTFEITSKMLINTNGVRLEKGHSVVVQLPPGQIPFGSDASKARVIDAFKFQAGVDLTDVKHALGTGYFKVRNV